MQQSKYTYQKIWRIAGVLCLAGCAFLVWLGPKVMTHGFSFLPIFLYWSVFLALLGAALYIALLDIRYIRLQYLLAERELFHETMAQIKKTQAERRPANTPSASDDPPAPPT